MPRLLVVDDEPVTLQITTALLQAAGHDVTAVNDSADALQHAPHVDVVITDLLMPGIDGYQLARSLLDTPGTRHVPVVFYSANYAGPEVQALAADCGVTHVVSRGDSPKKLLAAIDDALATGRPAANTPAPDFETRHHHLVNETLVANTASLAEHQAQLQTIAENAPIGILLLTPDGTPRYANPFLQNLTGCTPDGDNWATGIDPHTQRTLLTGEPGRTQLKTRTGVIRHVDLTRQAVHNANGSHTATVVIVNDITDLIRGQEREHRNRIDSLSRMASGVAHEFNNILAAVTGHLTFAIEVLDLDDPGTLTPATLTEARADLAACQHTLTRAGALTRQLLTFGRHDITTPRHIDLNDLLTTEADALTAALGPDITVSVDTWPTPLTVHADPEQLIAALHRLITNAAEAMPHGGSLYLRTSATLPDGDPTTSRNARLDITDTGTGMTTDTLTHAVEPFYSTKPDAHGTGLGLTEAHGIITQAGGTLTLTSTPGQGTTAAITLPLSAPQPSAPPPAPHPAHDDRQATILLADDDPDVRNITERVLQRAGHLIVTATNGQEALLAAAQTPVDCLVTDVQMPVMDGRELATQFTARYPGTPVIFISGYAGALFDEGTVDPGLTIVSKPFTRTDLLNAVTTALRAAHSRDTQPAT